MLTNTEPDESQTYLELTSPTVRIKLQQAADKIRFNCAANHSFGTEIARDELSFSISIRR